MYPVCLKCKKIFSIRMKPPTFELQVPYDKEVGDYTRDIEYFCPDMSCGGNIIYLDENMIPIILTLYERGYHTRSCCSSHLWNNRLYILFQEIYNMDLPPEPFIIKNDGFSTSIELISESLINPLVRWELLSALYNWALHLNVVVR